MNALLVFFLCATIFVPTLVNGLQCYYCNHCSNPFDPNNATIVTSNVTGQSCFKAAETSYFSQRGVMSSCIALNIGSNLGTWCCNTDLCNTAQSIAPKSWKIIIPSFLLAVGMIKLLQ